MSFGKYKKISTFFKPLIYNVVDSKELKGRNTVNYKSLKDHVYDYLANGLLTGEIIPNEKINETVICEDLSVSRTPVREALIQLTGEGVVQNIPRKGFVVKEIDYEGMLELYKILGELDGMAAEDACHNLNPADYDTLDALVIAMDDAIKEGDFVKYLRLQNSFHQTYINKCSNSTLINVLRVLTRKLLRKAYSGDEVGTIKKILADINNEHKEMVILFRNKDSKGLRDYMKDVHWKPNTTRYDIEV